MQTLGARVAGGYFRNYMINYVTVILSVVFL